MYELRIMYVLQKYCLREMEIAFLDIWVIEPVN